MRRRNSTGKRAAIIEATRRVLLRDGVWNTTTRKLAEEAQVPLATIHYHFEHKEQLLHEVFEEMLAQIGDAARGEFERPTPLADRIERALLNSWNYSEQHWREQFFVSELQLYAVRTEGASWIAERLNEGYLRLYTGILEGASDIAGHGALDIEGLARMMLVGIDGILLRHYAAPQADRSRQSLTSLIAMLKRYPLSAGPEPLTALTLAKPATRRRRG